MDDAEYGERLEVARKAKGWNQTQLGMVIGRSARMVREYEKGRRRVEPALRELIRAELGDFDAEGDPVEIAVRRSRLIEWRQGDVITTYQRHLFEQDQAERRSG